MYLQQGINVKQRRIGVKLLKDIEARTQVAKSAARKMENDKLYTKKYEWK